MTLVEFHVIRLEEIASSCVLILCVTKEAPNIMTRVFQAAERREHCAVERLGAVGRTEVSGSHTPGVDLQTRRTGERHRKQAEDTGHRQGPLPAAQSRLSFHRRHVRILGKANIRRVTINKDFSWFIPILNIYRMVSVRCYTVRGSKYAIKHVKL